MLYTVQDTTMTAFGDAVRSKVIGQSKAPTPISNYWVMTYNASRRYFEFPTFVKKIKLIGSVDYSSYVTIYGLQGLGVTTGLYTNSSQARDSKDFIVINEGVGFGEATDEPAKNYNFDFEIVIEGNTGTFACTKNSSSPAPLGLNFTAIGLDENGNEFKYTPAEMVDEINNLMTIPDEALIITGNCSYRFANGGWDWFISQCGDKIITNNITDTTQMFYNTDLKIIPFDINIASNISSIQNTFATADSLEVIPYIIGPEKKPPTSSYSGILNMGYLFNQCQRLRYIPEDYFWKIVPNKDFWEVQANLSTNGQNDMFGYCYSLRKLPDISMIGGNWTSSYGCIYYNLLNFCYSLDEATNIPVYGTFSSNAMSNLFYSNNRLKDFMFLMNEDGTPKTANWKNQTIDFTTKGSIGYGSYSPSSYNGGITIDKKVTDDATYQALKDDPDWYTDNIDYSRYNHDSAVNTINSLPDTSAYGTNTIKFMGASGALTDGGAINTLTEEEIAIATAKGWTVSLV